MVRLPFAVHTGHVTKSQCSALPGGSTNAAPGESITDLPLVRDTCPVSTAATADPDAKLRLQVVVESHRYAKCSCRVTLVTPAPNPDGDRFSRIHFRDHGQRGCRCNTRVRLTCHLVDARLDTPQLIHIGGVRSVDPGCHVRQSTFVPRGAEGNGIRLRSYRTCTNCSGIRRACRTALSHRQRVDTRSRCRLSQRGRVIAGCRRSLTIRLGVSTGRNRTLPFSRRVFPRCSCSLADRGRICTRRAGALAHCSGVRRGRCTSANRGTTVVGLGFD